MYIIVISIFVLFPDQIEHVNKSHLYQYSNYKTTPMIMILEEKGLLTFSRNLPKLLDIIANCLNTIIKII